MSVSGCYSLVDDFVSTEIPIGISPTPTIGVARITPSPVDQLQFQPGDVLGFYVESHGDGPGSQGDADNGVVLLTSGSYTNELMWYGSIGVATAQISQTGNCPYPVGTNGVLSSSTHAAPVISISVITYSCHQSSSITVAPSSISSPFSIQPTYSSYNSHPSSARTFSISSPFSIQPNYSSHDSHPSSARTFSFLLISSPFSIQPTHINYNSHSSSARTFFASRNIHVPSVTIVSTPIAANAPGSMIYHIGLISGIVAASIIVCISTVIVTLIIYCSCNSQTMQENCYVVKSSLW